MQSPYQNKSVSRPAKQLPARNIELTVPGEVHKALNGMAKASSLSLGVITNYVIQEGLAFLAAEQQMINDGVPEAEGDSTGEP